MIFLLYFVSLVRAIAAGDIATATLCHFSFIPLPPIVWDFNNMARSTLSCTGRRGGLGWGAPRPLKTQFVRCMYGPVAGSMGQPQEQRCVPAAAKSAPLAGSGPEEQRCVPAAAKSAPFAGSGSAAGNMVWLVVELAAVNVQRSGQPRLGR